ncbi:MAG: PTH1 family peptidyl-tRNA hydrolase [Sphingobacteriales bacterium]|jgi:PTH1 family peptidyl-tRNA hydrolase
MQSFLVVGLGNPGEEYNATRHNIGFEVLDYLAKAEGEKWETARYGDICTIKNKGRKIHLLKPSTFMNLSGKAVLYWQNELNIPLESILVVVDDLALPLGKVRLRGKGSDGGHNGLKDIQLKLNTTDYKRLRFGIGDEFSKGKQINFVLGKFSEEEWKTAHETILKCMDAIKGFSTARNFGEVMTQFNK